VIIGTAGHIDHGKTTLVRALTGIDTDRLKEEKQRGISIELGYAYVPLANGEMLGFVDVPGHEKLIHTMAAGATGIDFALLVIAADDGVMPQTREHLAILDLLGVTHGAVALTKSDRVEAARIADVRHEIEGLLTASALRDAPVFVVNASRADDVGIAALRTYLHATSIASDARSSAGLFRLAVDRVFTLAGHGTIVTGTAHAGRVRTGDSVRVMPQGLTARVRAIHANNRESETGSAGQRCAINLSGLEKSDLARGDWLADARAFSPSPRIDVRLHLLDGAAALRNWSAVHVHLGATHALAHIVPLEADVIAPNTATLVQLVFDAPICTASGDRVLIRDAQARHTLGGGRVLDANAPARKRRSAERKRYLGAVESWLEARSLDTLFRGAPFGISISDLERITAMPIAALAVPTNTHSLQSKSDRCILAESRWLALRETALTALGEFHAKAPEEAGVEITRLRRIALPVMPDSPWRALIEELIFERRIARNGPWLHLPEHHVAISDVETRLAGKLMSLISAGGFDPPWVRDLAKLAATSETSVRRTLRKISAHGDVHQVVPDLFYAAERVRELAGIVAQLASEHGEIEAAAFRDRIDLGRKRAIQILEFFDRVGYTRRVHDARKLRSGHDDLFQTSASVAS
jgi:selenocysteine-specific elongation factor